MNTKHYKLLILLVIVFCIYSFTLPTIENPRSNAIKNDSSFNYLALYGKFIFKRESCSKCHTLKEAENLELVSLDGINGKYPNVWHFRNLQDPRMTSYDSRMPSYYFLNTRFLQQPTFDSLLTTINKNKIILDHNNIWQKILDQANQIFNDLKKENLPVKNRTEILALISYLQSILSSDEKLKRDSIKNEQRKKEQIIWDNLVLDSNSIIYKTAKDKNSIELGKVIYKSTCVVCHGESGGGLIGPNLTDDNWLHGSSVFDIAKTIINGVPEKGMMAWRNNYNPEEVGQLVAYITSLKGSNPENAKIKQGIKE